MASIGNLDRRITFQRNTPGVPDGFGLPAESWADIGTVWASRNDVSDGEKVSAGQASGALLSRFVVRSSSLTLTLNGKDRISYGDAIWNILGVKETGDGRNRFLEITAVRESD